MTDPRRQNGRCYKRMYGIILLRCARLSGARLCCGGSAAPHGDGGPRPAVMAFLRADAVGTGALQ